MSINCCTTFDKSSFLKGRITIVKQMLLTLRRFNLFVDGRKRDEQDGEVLRDQILSTRVYLVLMTIMLVIALFILFTEMTIQVTVDNPSFETYKYLETIFSDTLSCPCDQIAVLYSSFISIETTYHQVKSDFV